MVDLSRHWPGRLADHTAIRDRLVAAYAGADRGYHDVRHLQEVLDRIGVILDGSDADPYSRDVDFGDVLLAAWFHDAVYDPDGDNEERSARLAEVELTAAGLPPDAVAEVARLVRLTATHDPADDDLAGMVLCDADLAILAAPRERYAEYTAGVRREYAHVSDDDFRRGRAQVLRTLLDRPALFRTAFGRRQWESMARANVVAELAALTAQVG